MKQSSPPPSTTPPLVVAGLYFLCSCLWIVLTDRLLNRLSLSSDAIVQWSIVKGLLFVGTSSGLIYLLLKKVSKANMNLEATVASRTSALASSERELNRSEERLRALLANLPDVTWTSTANRQTIYISPNIERVIGYTAAEICERGSDFWFARIHPGDSQRVAEAFQRLFREGRSFDVEYRLQRKDGQWVWVYDRATSTHVEDGVWYADGIFSDITGRKEAEEARRTILEAAMDGFYLADLQGKILEVNEAYCAMSGFSRAELMEMNVCELECMESNAQVAEHMQRIIDQRADRFETRHRRKDGQLLDIETSVTFQGGRFVCFLRDITERKHSEQEMRALGEQLQQAQKMEAVGRLAGGVAHDFNNLLMVIRSYTEMLQECLPPRDNLRRYAQEVLKAADRAAGLTGQMLAFSRKQMLTPVVLDLNALLDETAAMVERLIGEDIEVKVNPAESLWAIEADPDKIVQVLMNLCVNARDAMPEGGNLTLATRNISVGTEMPAKLRYLARGDYVSVSITDTGVGMTREVQERLFEPFFTTKGVGKGTGLGLATVYGIVQQSGGDVGFDSELGRGTTFTIYLPKAKNTIASVCPLKVESSLRGTETLLVVEDEAALRDSVCEFLRNLGYTVMGAESGQQALLLAARHECPIDLLITDVVMPKMSGRELSQSIGALRPELRTIFMSGYTDDAIVRHGVREAGTAFLQKPFSLATLSRKVREVIGQAQPRR